MSKSDELTQLKTNLEKWTSKVRDRHLATSPERRPMFDTDVGLEIKSLYTPVDLAELMFDYEKDLGFPGQYPFTRGIDPSMYRGQPWIIRAYSGFGEAQTCNQRYKRLLEYGLDEIVMALDLPTQVGYDSDHIMAKGEVGRVGVAIDSLHDMEILFEGIPLNRLKRVSMLGNSFGPIALALFMALGEKQGLKPTDYVVDLQNDILKEYVARGTYIYPVQPSVRLATDVIGYCARNARHWYPCTLCANHMNAAGAGSIKATAFAMANGLHYIDQLLQAGYRIDEVAPLFTMFLDERTDFFIAIALFRAARKIWAKLMREKFGTQDPDSMTLRITAYSHGGETLLEPMNNIPRITLAALAYVLGGVQFLYNACFDEVLGTPTEEAAKIAIRTQQVLAYELGITNTVDPLGGSYFIESLTKEIEFKIMEELDGVEKIGGAVAAIEKGYYVSQITDGALRRQKDFDAGKKVSIGVNKFRTEKNIPSGAFRIDPQAEHIQIERLRHIRAQRNNKIVQRALDVVRSAAGQNDNLVPPILEAVRHYATIGEICDVLRKLFGEHQAREYFGTRR